MENLTTNHMDSQPTTTSSQEAPTNFTVNHTDPEAPIDGEHAALSQLGEPFKRANGTWSDGGTDTHTPNGHFRKDWTKAMSNSQNRRWLLQLALTRCCNVIDIIEIMGSLMRKAKGGDRHCAELVLKYVVGDPVTMELMQRMHTLEAAAGLKGQAPTDIKADQEALEITKTLKLAEASVA